MKMGFVHLHVHSEYSLLDGAIRIPQLIQKVKASKQKAIAITDHGNLYGSIEFYKECKQNSIKPIIGCEIYLTEDINEKIRDNYHLILLCKNIKGYKNLLKIASKGYLDGFYYRPRVDLNYLKKRSEGLIALSGCLKGWPSQLILKDNPQKADEKIKQLKSIFGKNLFIELQDHDIPEQETVNNHLTRLAQMNDLPCVITNDAHYLNKEDARAQEILMAITTGAKSLDDEDRLEFQSNEFYLKSEREIWDSFALYDRNIIQNAIANTEKIADMCNLELELGKIILPEFPIENNKTDIQHLKELCEKEFPKKYKEQSSRDNNRENKKDNNDEKNNEKKEQVHKEQEQAKARLEHELAIIEQMGFASYFLIVKDFIDWANVNGVTVGPGRGSAPSSIVAYLLGITKVNPIKHNLLFERFLNPARISMPDIDTDFDDKNRHKMFEYMKHRYGERNVAQICTFDRMMAKGIIKDVGRVLGINFAETNTITKFVSSRLGIDKSLKEIAQLREYEHKYPELFIIARKLEGIARNISVHAAGIVISREPLINYVALQRSKDDIVTQLEMHNIEDIGLLKFDFLGLRFLTVIKECKDMIEGDSSIRLGNLKTYELLGRGDAIGLFQVESDGMRDLLKKYRPNKFEDISTIIALYRPGAAQFIDEFIARKEGRRKVTYLHPIFKEVLEETYGIIVYQEQVMMIAVRAANYSLAKADILRKAMGKKIYSLMESQKIDFIEGCMRNGMSQDIAMQMWDQIKLFASYGFNKSHSVAYAMVTYATAYLKANHPIQYMCALLSSVMGNEYYIEKYIKESKRMGIKIECPEINRSKVAFSVEDNKIRIGLAAIKNIGYSLIEEIIRQRPYSSFLDFCMKINLSKVNKRSIESLIKAGCFDSYGYTRLALLTGYEGVVEYVRMNTDGKSVQTTLDAKKENIISTGFSITEPTENRDINAENISFERDAFGIFVSGHPLDNISYKGCTLSDSLPEIGWAKVIGIVSSIKEITDKNNNLMAFLELEDIKGKIEIVVFSKAYAEFNGSIVPYVPLKIEGRIDNGKILASKIATLR